MERAKMANPKRVKSVKVGDRLVFNKLPDATQFEVVEIHPSIPFGCYVKEAGTEYRKQYADWGSAYYPPSQGEK